MSAGEKIAGHDADTGERLWEVVLPGPEGQLAYVTATPLRVGGVLIVGYHTTQRTEEPRDVNTRRLLQRVAVVDLEARGMSEAFSTVDLTASVPASDGSGDVDFLPAHTRGPLALPAPPPGLPSARTAGLPGNHRAGLVLQWDGAVLTHR